MSDTPPSFSARLGFFRRTCRQVTALVVAREDRQLPWPDRVAVYLHLKVCQECPRFEAQMLAMRHGLRRWRNYAETDGTE